MSELKVLNTLNKKYKSQYGFSVPQKYSYKAKKGLNREVVEMISKMKKEPKWMRDFRLNAYDIFESKSIPDWGADLSTINFQDIYYYIKPVENERKSWDAVPDEIKNTFERLGVPQAERAYLAGIKAQYESEIVYGSLLSDLEKKGVVFMGTDEALIKHPEIFKEYFSTVIPASDNKFAALNSAVWSGGSFIYVPKGVRIELPLQAYFRINARSMGQFERTLIIADEDSYIHYIEGCTAPIYSKDSLHAAVVEIIVKKNARVRYTTIQNWSENVYNLVTKRAQAYENAVMEWVDGNLGSKITMKYPAVELMEPGAHGEVLSIAYAHSGMHQDAGAKMTHHASNTSSIITSKSISKGSGRSSYRGLIKVDPDLKGIKSSVICDALLLDKESRTDTYPYMDIKSEDVSIAHEASVSKISEEQLFYIQSRGISEDEAKAMIVSGFIEPIVKEIPMEYALELNRLIQLEMEGSVG